MQTTKNNESPVVHKTTAERLSYIFHSDGSIETFINVDTPIIVDGNQYTKFPVDKSPKDFTIAEGDELLFKLSQDEGKVIDVTIAKSSDKARTLVHPNTCPICGTPLSKSRFGIGRCLNRSCKAQLTQNILYFLNACDMDLRYPVNRILTNLFTRGGLQDLTGIFKVGLNDLQNTEINNLEARIFLQKLHSIRGHVSVAMFLRGLRIDRWSLEDVFALDAAFKAKHMTLEHIPQLFDPANWDICDNLDWSGWEEVCALDGNLRVIGELSRILYR